MLLLEKKKKIIKVICSELFKSHFFLNNHYDLILNNNISSIIKLSMSEFYIQQKEKNKSIYFIFIEIYFIYPVIISFA